MNNQESVRVFDGFDNKKKFIFLIKDREVSSY